MIKIYTNEKGDEFRVTCLSTDDKPLGVVPSNTILEELDTGKKFYYDAEAGDWDECYAAAPGGKLPVPVVADIGKIAGVVPDGDGAKLGYVSVPEQYDLVLQLNGTGEYAPDAYTVVVLSGSLEALVQKLTSEGSPAAAKMLCVVNAYYGEVIVRENVVAYPYVWLDDGELSYLRTRIANPLVSTNLPLLIKYDDVDGWVVDIED